MTDRREDESEIDHLKRLAHAAALRPAFTSSRLDAIDHKWDRLAEDRENEVLLKDDAERASYRSLMQPPKPASPTWDDVLAAGERFFGIDAGRDDTVVVMGTIGPDGVFTITEVSP